MGLKIAALAEMAAFYGCYIVKMLSQRRKGIQIAQTGKGKTGFVKWIELTMKFSAIAVFSLGLGSILLDWGGKCFPLRLAGAVLGAAGTLAFILAVQTMRDSWRAGVPETDKTELVKSGIYQISRNPAFLGFDLLYIGIVCMYFNWPLFFVSVFAVVMYHLQIVNVEEPFLQTAFGEDYLDYCKTVCRYLGRKG